MAQAAVEPTNINHSTPMHTRWMSLISCVLRFYVSRSFSFRYASRHRFTRWGEKFTFFVSPLRTVREGVHILYIHKTIYWRYQPAKSGVNKSLHLIARNIYARRVSRVLRLLALVGTLVCSTQCAYVSSTRTCVDVSTCTYVRMFRSVYFWCRFSSESSKAFNLRASCFINWIMLAKPLIRLHANG